MSNLVIYKDILVEIHKISQKLSSNRKSAESNYQKSTSSSRIDRTILNWSLWNQSEIVDWKHYGNQKLMERTCDFYVFDLRVTTWKPNYGSPHRRPMHLKTNQKFMAYVC